MITVEKAASYLAQEGSDIIRAYQKRNGPADTQRINSRTNRLIASGREVVGDPNYGSVFTGLQEEPYCLGEKEALQAIGLLLERKATP